MRVYHALVILAVILAAPTATLAKAHLIAIIPLRSTSELAETAQKVTRQLVDRAATIPGFDAQIIPTGGRTAVDAAAAVGAEIYIVGQIVGDDLTVESFDVASDHRINRMHITVDHGVLPSGFDIGALLGNGQSLNASAVAVTSSGSSTTYLLVPFGAPSNKDTALDFATTEFVKKMEAKGVVVVATEPIEQAEAGASVPRLCKEHTAGGIFIGTARHEQRLNYFLGSYPTHAEVRVTLFPCGGSQPLWKGYGTGDLVYYWANAGAAVSDAIDKALDIVVAQFNETVLAPKPTSSPAS